MVWYGSYGHSHMRTDDREGKERLSVSSAHHRCLERRCVEVMDIHCFSLLGATTLKLHLFLLIVCQKLIVLASLYMTAAAFIQIRQS